MINFAAAAVAARFTGQARILKNWRSGSKRFRRRSQQKRSLVIGQTTGKFAAVQRLIILFIFAGTALAAFAQGPAPSPSPLISLPSPPPAKSAARIHATGFRKFSRRVDSVAITKPKHRRRGHLGGERRSSPVHQSLRL